MAVTEPETAAPADPATAWLGALEARHLADLRPAEVGRALRALSSAYVERRDRLARGAALDGAGKRAAFALFYGPLHFLVVRAIVRALALPGRPVDLIADLGCGTGVAGAAWALECDPHPRVFGVERHPWAADEARWTCRALGLEADVRCGDLARVRLPARASAVVAAYTANELPDRRAGGAAAGSRRRRTPAAPACSSSSPSRSRPCRGGPGGPTPCAPPAAAKTSGGFPSPCPASPGASAAPPASTIAN